MKKLIKSLKLKEIRKGRSSQFSSQGKLALMFLKAYSGQSDRKLYEHLNSNIQYQLFCGILLGPEKLVDFKIISKIRGELAKKLNIREVQDVFAKSWKPYLENPNIVLEDDICYESYMRFPTNVKLILESVDWIERFWKSIKYDYIYLNPCDNGLELFEGVQNHIEYNNQKKHQTIRKKPNEAYPKSICKKAA